MIKIVNSKEYNNYKNGYYQLMRENGSLKKVIQDKNLEIENLKCALLHEQNSSGAYIGKYNKYKQKAIDFEEEVNKLKNEVDGLNSINIQLEREKADAYLRISNLSMQLEQSKNTIADLEKKIKELMSDKYVVKKLPSGRTPKSQRIGSKSSVASKSNILKYMKEEEQN